MLPVFEPRLVFYRGDSPRLRIWCVKRNVELAEGETADTLTANLEEAEERRSQQKQEVSDTSDNPTAIDRGNHKVTASQLQEKELTYFLGAASAKRSLLKTRSATVIGTAVAFALLNKS